MQSKTLIALAAASILQGVIAASPRQHGHQHLHEKRAIVTEVVTETSWVTVTLSEGQAAPTAAAASAKKFYSRKRPSRTRASSSAIPTPSSSAPVIEAIRPTFAAPTQVQESANPDVVPVPTTAVVVAPVPDEPAATDSPATTSPSTGGGSGGGSGGVRGRGLAYNDPNLLTRFLSSGSKISWTYNWAQTDDSKTGLEFVPMLWGTSKGFPATWAANAQRMIDAGAKCLFSFNEPDNDGQAHLSPAAAAASHIELMNPFQGKARIGAPAITNSNRPNEGIPWLKQWFDACGGKCAVDFVNIHIYGVDTITFLNHLLAVHNAFNKPVWITEFAFGGSEDEINRQLGTVLDQIDNNATFSFVERVSYFMAADGIMVKGNSMSSYGNSFAYGS
jgi:hypothetical protein